ncbi:MAG: V-type ATPase 116kDa subunit family protein, partial [Dermatophilaceae bacterium]
LLFAVALGFAHVLLGLGLGLWTAVRRRNRHKVAELTGTLVVLFGLAGLVANIAGLTPPALLPVWFTMMLAGLVLASASHGALGPLLGPLELIGTIGNILSYLRLAAVGLASVYLANVANELAVQAPLVLGIVVAVFFHTLNLGLAAFSPTVQALRLHYVEFFSKFHDGGGRAFRPLGAHGALAADATPVALPLPHAPAGSRPEHDNRVLAEGAVNER